MLVAQLVLSAILFIGALLHAYGSVLAFRWASPELVWSVGASGFAILLAAVAALSAFRRGDAALSAIMLAGCVGWVAVVVAYGIVIGKPADPRVLYHLIVGLALAGFALRALLA